MEKYTFLAIAPCTFTVLGKHFSLEAGSPFETTYEEAKIISAPNFRFRNYVRVITPIIEPKKALPVEPESVTTEKKPDAKLVEPVEEINLAVEPVQLGIQPELEVEPEPTNKKRRRAKETISESTSPINNEDLF